MMRFGRMQRAVAVVTVAVVALTVLVMRLGVGAQTPPSPSVAGQWLMSVTVTKGNEKDQSRLGSGGAMRCVQAGSNVICRGEGTGGEGTSGGNLLSGTLNGTNLVLDGEWPGDRRSTVGALHCFYYTCTMTSRSRTYKVKMHFEGSLVNEGLLEGKWTAVLLVGLGRYDVEGTWKAIKG